MMNHQACEQGCGATAECYAMGRSAGDWGGHYCLACANSLGWTPTDTNHYPKETTQ